VLTKIVLKNFKLHANTEIEAAPITVFIGPNNSGKSSIFQACLLWRQAATRGSHILCAPWTTGVDPFVFAEDQLIDIGDFQQVVRHGEREISIRIVGSYPAGKTIEYGPGPTTGEFEVRIRENNLVYHRGTIDYRIDALDIEKRFSWEWTRSRQPGQVGFPVQPAKNVSLVLVPSNVFSLIGQVNWTSSGPVQISPEENIALSELANRFHESVRTLLSCVHPVFPIRGFEQVTYPFPATPATSADRMGVADRAIALVSVLASNRAIQRQLSAWLERLLGISIDVEQKALHRGTLLSSSSDNGSLGSLFSNEGTGTSQLPFILVPIGLTPEGETIFLSEPEVHLHPKLQVEVARLLLRLAKEEKRQFFVETHSEHLLHALLNAVAIGALDRKDLAIYYFENKDGTAVTKRLNVDERGGVEGGLPGFFDQSLDELSEYLSALKNK
jgi:energy-coupling factor transporter ATP-binding protein EcfA2